MIALCLPAHVDASEAIRYFTRPRPTNLFGLLALRHVRVMTAEDAASKKPPCIEQIWMPAYAVLVHTHSAKGERTVWGAVEAVSGEFSMLECDNELTEEDLAGDCYDPALTEEQAALIARRGVLQYILTQRGQINKPVVDGIESIRPYWYPVWVCYVPRGKRLDLRVLDARTGKSGGAKMRMSVVNALVHAHIAGREAAAEALHMADENTE